MNRWRNTAWLATALMVLAPLQQAMAATTPAPTGAAGVYFDQAFDAQEPSAVYNALWHRQESRTLNFKERMDLGMALFLQQKPEQSAGVFSAVAAGTDKPSEKVVALMYAAQAYAAAHDWKTAGQIANQANRLAPTSKSLAAMRFTFWKAAGDPLESKAAEDRLAQLDVRYDGKVVFEPITTGLIILAIVAAASTAYVVTWTIVTKPDAAQFLKVLQEMKTWIPEVTAAAIVVVLTDTR